MSRHFVVLSVLKEANENPILVEIRCTVSEQGSELHRSLVAQKTMRDLDVPSGLIFSTPFRGTVDFHVTWRS